MTVVTFVDPDFMVLRFHIFLYVLLRIIMYFQISVTNKYFLNHYYVF